MRSKAKIPVHGRPKCTSKEVVRYVIDDYVNHVTCLASDVLEPHSCQKQSPVHN